MISITCPSCGTKYRLDNDMAGRKVRCRCGTKMLIPSQRAIRIQKFADELDHKQETDTNEIKPAALNAGKTVNITLEDVAGQLPPGMSRHTAAITPLKSRRWLVLAILLVLLTAGVIILSVFFMGGGSRDGGRGKPQEQIKPVFRGGTHGEG